MALELKQSLGLTQQLIMTPQLQQAIKLLQLSRLELLDAIHEEMESNPVLEERLTSDPEEDGGSEETSEELNVDVPDLPEVDVVERAREDVDWENYISEYNSSWAESSFEEIEPPSFENTTAAKSSLYSHLTWQLNMSDLSEEQREIGIHIIGNLDDDGYLHVPLEEIPQLKDHSIADVLETLRFLQNFDPVGIAARDTRECLLIQARFQGLGGTLVEKIIMDHLGDLEHKKYQKIAKTLSVPMNDVLSAVSILQGLEPKPGRIYSDDETIYIIPDIYVFKVGDNYEIVQNEDGLPKLRINAYYREILRSGDALSEKARVYIQEKLRSAAWLIKSIHQRQRTIYRVTDSIFRFQRDFLDKGVTYLKPLVLRDVAEAIDMHESTVSRVTTNKYVYTPQGVFELKFFFNSSLNSVDGDMVASESVKEHIRNIVKAENKFHPRSDQEIVEILRKMKITVARRTVAKYREAMRILPSRKRRSLF